MANARNIELVVARAQEFLQAFNLEGKVVVENSGRGAGDVFVVVNKAIPAATLGFMGKEVAGYAIDAEAAVSLVRFKGPRAVVSPEEKAARKAARAEKKAAKAAAGGKAKR